jgi:hypothetical protein
MDDRQQIETIKSQTLAQLVAIRIDPKPTYSVDGQSVSWESYAESLQRTVDWCDRKLSDYEPFEFQTRGDTP